MATTDLVLLDTCVILSNPDIILRVQQKGGHPVITNTVLTEIDNNKRSKTGTDETKNINARSFLKELATNGVSPSTKSSPLSPLGNDHLSHTLYKSVPLTIIHRQHFRATDNNDTKIIEIALDYDLLLISADRGMVVRASAAGTQAYFWDGREIAAHTPSSDTKPRPRQHHSARNPEPPGKPFNLPTSATPASDQLIATDEVPGTQDTVQTLSGAAFQLIKRIGGGGEGDIFTTNAPGMACKVYKREKLTNNRRAKIELMLTRPVPAPGIAWPTHLLFNNRKQFVGYAMPHVQGIPLQPTLMVKPRLLDQLPDWTRLDLVEVSLNFLHQVQALHELNVIIGDINPLNILVDPATRNVSLVDTDSFQVERFPCPVGTVNFTAPEIQGVDYKTFLRTKDHELFAVATMLFMLLLPGKPPYSHEGGGSPGENIKNRHFAYPFHNQEKNIEFHGEQLPEGPYRYIWSHLSYRVKEAFHETFRESQRVSLARWIDILKKYQFDLRKGWLSDEIFPLGYKIPKGSGVTLACSQCGTKFEMNKDWVLEQQEKGIPPVCYACKHANRLVRLAGRAAQRDPKNQSEARHTRSQWNAFISHSAKRTTRPKSQFQHAGAQSKAATTHSASHTTGPKSPNVSPQKPAGRSHKKQPLAFWIGAVIWLAIFAFAFKFGGFLGVGIVIALVATFGLIGLSDR